MVSLGINVANFGRRGDPRVVREMIIEAEGSDVDLVMVSDHVAVTPDVNASYPAPFLEAFSLLAWAAGFTKRLTLGTTVAILPLRHPLLVGAMTDTIERLSGRPFILGVGTGWAEQEYRALGVDFSRRGPLTEDYLAALSSLGSAEDHRGEHSAFEAVASGRRPGQVWIGGNGPVAIRRAQKYGDAWHPLGVTLASLRTTGVPALRSAAAPPALAPRVKLDITSTASAVPDENRDLGNGNWDQVESDLQGLVALGCSHIILDPDVPAVRAGADPWPLLTRATTIIRAAEVARAATQRTS